MDAGAVWPARPDWSSAPGLSYAHDVEVLDLPGVALTRGWTNGHRAQRGGTDDWTMLWSLGSDVSFAHASGRTDFRAGAGLLAPPGASTLVCSEGSLLWVRVSGAALRDAVGVLAEAEGRRGTAPAPSAPLRPARCHALSRQRSTGSHGPASDTRRAGAWRRSTEN